MQSQEARTVPALLPSVHSSYVAEAAIAKLSRSTPQPHKLPKMLKKKKKMKNELTIPGGPMRFGGPIKFGGPMGPQLESKGGGPLNLGPAEPGGQLALGDPSYG